MSRFHTNPLCTGSPIPSTLYTPHTPGIHSTKTAECDGCNRYFAVSVDNWVFKREHQWRPA